MELGQIKNFILTAQLQNMSKAALALNVAQPTLSKSISNLEKELGAQLFDRSGKKLILNERGKKFLERAGAAVEELENAAAAVRDKAADDPINIGLFCASGRFMRCLSRFSGDYPDLLFHISYLYDSLDHIDVNEYDVLIYPRNSLFRRYRGQRAYTEKYLLAVHRNHSFAAKAQVSLCELQEEKLIFIKYDARRYDESYHLYRGAVEAKRGYHVCNSFELQRMMISADQGAGFVPEESAAAYIKDDDIVLLTIADTGFERDVFVGFKREKHLSERGRLFASFVTEYFELNAEG